MANGLFGGGDGTELNPYIVEDASDLDAVRNNLYAHYKQNNNINLKDVEWIPIGLDEEYSFSDSFYGSYDGGNFVIYNLTIERPDDYYLGLFAECLDGVVLRNIKISNVYIIGNESCGGLCGESRSVQFLNCHIEGGVIETVGGGVVGGLTGADYGYESSFQPKMINCSVSCEIKGSGGDSGGLTSRCGANSLIENCYTKGTVVSPEYSGGLLGWAQDGSVIRNCYSNSDVLFEGEEPFGTYSHAGLVGFAETCEIINCYATGYVTGLYNVSTHGLVGQIGNGDNLTIINSYYDSETSGQSDTDKGTPKTTAEMMQKSTFVGWDFNAIWRIDEGKDYPRFLFEPVDCLAFPLSTLKVNIIN